MKACGKPAREMAKALLLGLMEANLLVCGGTICALMVKCASKTAPSTKDLS